MLKTQIGLGVLTIPQTFSVLGLLPGIICVVLIAAMITWSNYIIGIFKLRYPNVYGKFRLRVLRSHVRYL